MGAADKYLMYPVKHVGIVQPFISGQHYGIDLGWSTAGGGANGPILASGDGTVIDTQDGLGNMPTSDSWGNYILIDHGDGVRTRSAHLLKGSLLVRVGDHVSRGQQIASMNNSGHSFGCHDHFEVYENGNRVDPVPRTWVYPEEQTVSSDTSSNYSLLYYNGEADRIGHPVERNTANNQIVIHDDKRIVRNNPSGAALENYLRTGIYDMHEAVASDGLWWIRVDTNYSWWIAWLEDDGDLIYPAPIPAACESTDRDESKNQIEVKNDKQDTYTNAEMALIPTGVIYKGIYDVSEKVDDGTYTWYRIAKDAWVRESEDITYYQTKKIRRVGTPVQRDTTKNQIYITDTIRNVRNVASISGDRLGFINIGIYNWIDVTSADGHQWYQVEKGYYVAYFSDLDVLYPIDTSKEEIEKLKKEIIILTKQVEKHENTLKEINKLSIT